MVADRAQKTVVITGASAGVGRAVARHFGQRGWRVALVARDQGRLEKAAAEVRAGGGEAFIQIADVADAEAIERVGEQVVARWGAIHAWVNCAMSTVVSPIVETSAEEYRRVTQVTYLGAVHGTLTALRHMRAQDEGVIVQVGSALAYRAIPLQSAYCGAKFALRGFTDSLRTELLHDGSKVKVTMVQLPGVNTPQFDWARNKLGRKHKPAGSVYQPEVAARAIYQAAIAAPRELWVGADALKAIIGQIVAPALLDRLMAKQGWSGQIDSSLKPAKEDNLYHTVDWDEGAHGRFDDRAKASGIVVNPETARLLTAIGVSGLLIALAKRALSAPSKQG